MSCPRGADKPEQGVESHRRLMMALTVVALVLPPVQVSAPSRRIESLAAPRGRRSVWRASLRATTQRLLGTKSGALCGCRREQPAPTTLRKAVGVGEGLLQSAPSRCAPSIAERLAATRKQGSRAAVKAGQSAVLDPAGDVEATRAAGGWLGQSGTLPHGLPGVRLSTFRANAGICCRGRSPTRTSPFGRRLGAHRHCHCPDS
jgi:hypothetical protein